LPYDLLRVIAICAVLGIHSLMTARDLTRVPPLITMVDSYLHFAVPLLVFISGALTWSSSKKRSYKKFALHRLQRLGLPYLAWFCVYIVLTFIQTPGKKITVGWLLGNLLTGNVWYHLYFIPMILTFALLTPVASKALRLFKYAPELLFVLAFLLKAFGWTNLGPLVHAHLGAAVWGYLAHIVMHLPDMILGAWFALRFKNVITKAAQAKTFALFSSKKGSGLAAHKVIANLRFSFITLGLTFLAFAIAPWLHKIERPLTSLSMASFGVFLVHPVFLFIIQRLVASLGAGYLWTNWWFILGVFSLLFVFSYGASYALLASKYSAWSVGE